MAGKLLQTLLRLLRLWGLYARMDALWFLRDTRYCLANIATDVISNLTGVAGVFLLAERFGSVGGMGRGEVLFMLGYASMLDGVFLLFFMMNNVGNISRRIGRGQLDHMLIQPLPLWMQLATEGFIPVSGSSKLIIGGALLTWATARLHINVTLPWLMALGGSLACSSAVVLGASYAASALAFWAPVAAEEISTTTVELFDIKTYPLGGLPVAAQWALCTALPVGLTAWFPANALLGTPPAGMPALLPLLLALTLGFAAAILFRKGLSHYAKTGCNRYLDRGHRR